MGTQKLKSIDGIVVNTKVIANIFGLSDRRVRQLVEEGIIDKVSAGRFDLHDTLKKYIAFLRTASTAEADEGKLRESLDYEKFLHERAKRELAELDLAEIKGQLHNASQVEKVMTRMLADLRARLLAIPTKVAPSLIARNEISVIQDLLHKEIHQALQELSEYDPSLFRGPKEISKTEIEEVDLDE